MASCCSAARARALPSDGRRKREREREEKIISYHARRAKKGINTVIESETLEKKNPVLTRSGGEITHLCALCVNLHNGSDLNGKYFS